MFKKVYIEITNVCNRSCSFCPGCEREKAFISPDDFETFAKKLKPYTDIVCLHVMGEPLIHPQLDKILSICDRLDLKVSITTNGTLLCEKEKILLSHPSVFRINISLHSFEANENSDERYFENCFSFADKSSKNGIVSILRLWNLDGRIEGKSSENDAILALLHRYFDEEWITSKRGFRIREKLFLEFDECFVWPSENGEIIRTAGKCRALSDQIAVLCDGTVVPCCLDGQGKMPLGNLYNDSIEEIMNSETVGKMLAGFSSRGEFHNKFCATCGFADRFDKKKNAPK